MVSTTYEVRGMSCGHCAGSVVTEVGAIDGVTNVKVDLEGGRVTVTSDDPLDTETVRAAVDEAGYTLVDA